MRSKEIKINWKKITNIDPRNVVDLDLVEDEMGTWLVVEVEE